MLNERGDSFNGKTVSVSGSGNVAQFATEKATQLGAKVVTLSDSSGTIYDKKGIDQEKLLWIMDLKNNRRGRIKEYADKFDCVYMEGLKPWSVKCDIALPCATQNEINGEESKVLIDNGVMVVSEGANMPSDPGAIENFLRSNILFAPGKAANAGGVATSGLEMSQNSMRLNWPREEVDSRLRMIMKDIHKACVQYGKNGGKINYVKGANIAGVIKVADAMLDQGVV